MALGGHRFQALAWGVGLFVCVVSDGGDPRPRAAGRGSASVIGATVAAVGMAAFTWARMSRAGEGSLETLIEAIEHEPIEI